MEHIKQAIESIQHSLPSGGAALVISPVNRHYLTGFNSSDGLLFIAKQAAVFLTDSRYIEAAQAAVTHCTVKESKDTCAQLRALCKQHRIVRVYIEAEHTTLEQAARLQKQLQGRVRLRSTRLDTQLRRLRNAKSAEEVQCIRRAQRIAEAALAHLLALPLAGMTEREAALELDYTMLRQGAEALSFETIAVAGENGSKPHGVPGSRKLRAGDFLTLDFGAVVDGYHSDMTRTVAIGTPGAEQSKIYDTVLRAQQAALEILKPGVPCKDVDAAARGVIENAGYGEHFRHSTGHGVGLEIHEAPSLFGRSKAVLEPGMVVTIEPGIYVPGFCGVRIEDMALITESGYENLTTAPKELIMLDE